MSGKILSSFGISGKECSAQLELLNVNSGEGGICWFYGENEPKNFKVVYENRTTVLIHNSGKKIIGAEHLSAASLAFPNCEFALHAPQGELPLLDGSSKLWKEALSEIAYDKSRPVKLRLPPRLSGEFELNFYNVSKNEFEIKNDGRYLKFLKSSVLEIEYTISRFGQEFSANAKIESIGDLEKILLARTFIFEQEQQMVKLSENLMNCGILLKSSEKNLLRFENEPAYHKILDFLGDISLYSNALPLGKFTIFNGGHELHHTAMGALI